MKIEEMRIGNFYHWEAEGKKYALQVDAKDFANDNYKNFEPISLTQEWHNKFDVHINGFKAFEYKLQNTQNLFITVVFTGDYVMLRQGEKKDSDNEIVSIWNNDVMRRGMYVHEWQNLFRSLTNQELSFRVAVETN